MTNLRHDRVPGQTLSPGSVPEARATADGKVPGSTRGTVLAIRLWTHDSSGQPGAVSWQGTSPAVCLALDVIAASGGALAAALAARNGLDADAAPERAARPLDRGRQYARWRHTRLLLADR